MCVDYDAVLEKLQLEFIAAVQARMKSTCGSEDDRTNSLIQSTFDIMCAGELENYGIARLSTEELENFKKTETWFLYERAEEYMCPHKICNGWSPDHRSRCARFDDVDKCEQKQVYDDFD